MSREIKFRAFVKEYNPSKEAATMVYSDRVGGISVLFRDFEDEPIMQFTGLKDKNGVEIYEGDIVSVVLIDKSGSKNQHFGKVFYQEYEFCIETDNDYWPVASWHCVYECEVIGDIYQNPGLLK